MTDENVVASAWGTKETSIKVIHYTGTRKLHSIALAPTFDDVAAITKM
jgi:hypothetical protein